MSSTILTIPIAPYSTISTNSPQLHLAPLLELEMIENRLIIAVVMKVLEEIIV